MDIKIVDLITACLLVVCVPSTLARYKVPADPLFSDAATDYDSPGNGIDYYDVKDYPLLKGEYDVYRKTKPGGLLLNSKTSGSKPSTVPRSSKNTRKPKVPARLRTTATPSPSTTPRGRANPGRISIDGSDPNTNVFDALRQARRRSTVSPNASPRKTLRDIVGNEIKPETASNRFLVMGTVRGCREVKREVHEHMFKKSTARNTDPSVTGLTAEIPPEITFTFKHRFASFPTGGKEFRFRTSDDDQGYIKLRWYSCPGRG